MITLKTTKLYLPEGFLNPLFEQYNDRHDSHTLFLYLLYLTYRIMK